MEVSRFLNRNKDFSYFSNNEKSWGYRFVDSYIESWRRRVPKILSSISDEKKRRVFVEETIPANQYKIIELLAKFGSPDNTIVKTSFDQKQEGLVGDIFGDLLIHHMFSSDVKRKTEFIDHEWSLEISPKSKIIGLLKLLEYRNNKFIAFNTDVRDYLINLLLKVNSEDDQYKKLMASVPVEILFKLDKLLQEKRKKSK